MTKVYATASVASYSVSERATYGIIDEEDRKREAGFAIKINESDTRDMNGNTIRVEYMYILEPAGVYPHEFPCWFGACLSDRRCNEPGKMYILLHVRFPRS